MNSSTFSSIIFIWNYTAMFKENNFMQLMTNVLNVWCFGPWHFIWNYIVVLFSLKNIRKKESEKNVCGSLSWILCTVAKGNLGFTNGACVDLVDFVLLIQIPLLCMNKFCMWMKLQMCWWARITACEAWKPQETVFLSSASY